MHEQIKMILYLCEEISIGGKNILNQLKNLFPPFFENFASHGKEGAEL